MQVEIVTLFPEMFTALDSGILGRAQTQKLVNLRFWNPRDYATGNYRKVDDCSYGGGAGMVMMVQPLRAAIQAARQHSSQMQLVYFTPQGELLTHQLVKRLAQAQQLCLVAGRYEGFDERLLQLEPGLEISIGDYVLTGGELPAMVLIDAVARQLEGVVGDFASVEDDSFYAGLLDYPHYTRPQEIAGLKVPEVLLQGDHRAIERWRRKQALGRTWLRRRDIFSRIELTTSDRLLLNEFIYELP